MNELEYLKYGLSDTERMPEEAEFELETISRSFVDKNLNVLRHYFGLGDYYKSISQMHNQSMIPLDQLFPELHDETESRIDLEIAKYGEMKTVLDKSLELNQRHNVKVIILDKNGFDKQNLEKMEEGSKIMSLCLKKHLSSSIPGYISAVGWTLLYQKSTHGTSFNT